MIRSALIAAALAVCSPQALADPVALFGHADTIWDAQISPDGAHFALGCSPNGKLAVCVYPASGEGRPKLFEPSPDQRLLNFYWASDAHVVINISAFERLNTSDGIQEIEVRRAFSYSLEGGDPAILMRQASNFDDLTDITSVCDPKPDKVLMELTTRASSGAATGSLTSRRNPGFKTVLYEVDLNTGRMDDIANTRDSVWTHIIDADCNAIGRVLYNDQSDQFAIVMDDGPSERTLLEIDNTPIRPMTLRGFTPDRKGLIVFVDHDGKEGIFRIDIETGELSPFTVNGEEVGTRGLLTSRFDGTVLGMRWTDDLRQHAFSDPTLAELQAMIGQSLPGKTITLRSHDRTMDRFTFAARAPGAPAEFYLVDLTVGQVRPLGTQAASLEGRPVATRFGDTYAARDGLDIPVYVTLPPGKSAADGPFPTIVMPHGGPEARDTAAFDWWAQAYAEAGYAVLQPNFRGSLGYGAAFRNAGFGEFGGAMIDDMVDAIGWAEAEGIADQAGVCTVGASYGGYGALMMGLRAPEKVGCITAVAPVTDIFAHIGRFERGSSSADYWERYVGGDRFDAAEVKRAVTPADRTGEYRVPVLLIHGRNDLVVTPSQSRMFERNWGGRDGLRYVKLENQDHYLTSSAARATVLRESLAHLAANHPAR